MEQQSLGLDVPGRRHQVHLFHDESGFGGKDRYGVHGMLAVPNDLLPVFGQELARIRRENRYYSEIHFKKLGGARSVDSAQWRVARDWLHVLFAHMFTKVRFKAFVVDMGHEDFDRTKYPTALATYRRFFITDAKSLIAWSLRGASTLEITPYTDAGNSSALRKRRRDGTLFDSFARYVVDECRHEREQNGKPFYPTEVVVEPLRAIDSSPSHAGQSQAAALGLDVDQLKIRCDFIQLADLLTSSLYAAFAVGTENFGKQSIAETVVEAFSALFDMPWHRALPLRRRFSVSCFPGPGRTPYAISLRGIRQYGIDYLRTHPDVAARLAPRSGWRPDAVDEGQMRLGDAS